MSAVLWPESTFACQLKIRPHCQPEPPARSALLRKQAQRWRSGQPGPAQQPSPAQPCPDSGLPQPSCKQRARAEAFPTAAGSLSVHVTTVNLQRFADVKTTVRTLFAKKGQSASQKLLLSLCAKGHQSSQELKGCKLVGHSTPLGAPNHGAQTAPLLAAFHHPCEKGTDSYIPKADAASMVCGTSCGYARCARGLWQSGGERFEKPGQGGWGMGDGRERARSAAEVIIIHSGIVPSALQSRAPAGQGRAGHGTAEQSRAQQLSYY
ncbi:hypothetical protein AXG93_2016s1070 [Marchantia polymorpha subsp. ruderalis]|uniref:Uncharacterized protein n=1 Tax=Marchantia polymorpha subsp. ruderalis TaxID=1480154 RepID=A0A176VWC3_MARPO|nr:hypothetical protein AXG93_2016s1070 [Marchantia polymorpha subsp. ruderalis]